MIALVIMSLTVGGSSRERVALQAAVAGLSLEVYVGAVVLWNEDGHGDVASQHAIVHSLYNRLDAGRGRDLFEVATGRSGRFGGQRGSRPYATGRVPPHKKLMQCAAVVRDVVRDRRRGRTLPAWAFIHPRSMPSLVAALRVHFRWVSSDLEFLPLRGVDSTRVWFYRRREVRL